MIKVFKKHEMFKRKFCTIAKNAFSFSGASPPDPLTPIIGLQYSGRHCRLSLPASGSASELARTKYWHTKRWHTSVTGRLQNSWLGCPIFLLLFWAAYKAMSLGSAVSSCIAPAVVDSEPKKTNETLTTDNILTYYSMWQMNTQ